MEEMRGACFAGSAPPFRGRERTAVDIDVCPERRSLRSHETCLALESVDESSAAVCKPRSVWLHMPIVEKASAAARNEFAWNCWQWPARTDGDSPDRAPCVTLYLAILRAAF